MNDRGPWIQCYSGGRFYPLDPQPGEVNIRDIAHALSMTCRYTGHCLRRYSVAEHSVLVSLHVAPAFALEGLLHDAAEAYLADVAKPVKAALPQLVAIEDEIHAAVAERFGLPIRLSAEVKSIDHRILADERALLLPRSRVEEWFPAGEPQRLDAEIECLEPWAAELRFLERFAELTDPRGTGRRAVA
jgi:5'-deoxynucleotidase YfbR-like HD superfamily hydrolase